MFEGLTFKLAEGPERLRALELRAKIYQEELGHCGVDRFDEKAHHLIAQDTRGEIVAASRILGPEQRPFEIEEFVDIASFVASARSPAQTGGLWVHPDHRTVSRTNFLPIGMLKLAHCFARKHAITDFVMYTYPHLSLMYRAAFYRPVDLAFKHPAWGEVSVLHLDLLDLEKRYAGSEQRMARLLFATSLPNFLV